MIGLCLAYFGFRKKLPLTLRSALYPVIGDRIYGPVGHAVDLLAVFGTVFGVATSLGLGVSQMATGLNYLFEIDPGVTTQVILIAVISIVATFSAVSGVGNGIRIISEWNIWLSVVLLATSSSGAVPVVDGVLRDRGGRLPVERHSHGLPDLQRAGRLRLQGGWTIFYWGWWISWAPFVGMFIARISRGRTIREFMLGVMFVPTTIAFFWLCIFGGNAMYLELTADGGVGTAGIAQLVRDWNLSSALYGTIERMTDVNWLNWVMAALATFLLATWFITSSDSGTLVITTMLSMGDDDPPQRFRIVLGIGEGFVAAALLLAGGLKALADRRHRGGAARQRDHGVDDVRDPQVPERGSERGGLAGRDGGTGAREMSGRPSRGSYARSENRQRGDQGNAFIPSPRSRRSGDCLPAGDRCSGTGAGAKGSDGRLVGRLLYPQPDARLREAVPEPDRRMGGDGDLRRRPRRDPRQVETENVVWDVVDFEQSDLVKGCREGLLEKLDHGALAAGADGTAAAEDFIPGPSPNAGSVRWSGRPSSPMTAAGSRAIAPPRSRTSSTSRSFPGERGLRRDPRVALEWALMADGVAPGEVYAALATEDGQQRAFSMLDRIRPRIVWWTTGSEPVQLLDSGAVVLTSAWNGRMYRPMVEEGKDYGIVWDGQLWDIDSWGVPKGTANLAKAMDFIAFATSSGQLAEQTKYISYGPARMSAMALVNDDTKAMLPTAEANMATALQTDADWWATHHEELSAKFEQWLAKGAGAACRGRRASAELSPAFYARSSPRTE